MDKQKYGPEFDGNCRCCERLAVFLDEIRSRYPAYHAGPVEPFGADNPGLLIVGLAPGMHGANATGRPFTGDYAGILLYRTLYEFGFSNKPDSKSAVDGLKLGNCRITNAVKCLPPQNRPTGAEVNQCNRFLQAELLNLTAGTVILALGNIAHQSVLKSFNLKLSSAKFGHNVVHDLPDGRYLVDSYHCSRYNINTRRLTEAMFKDVFVTISKLMQQ